MTLSRSIFLVIAVCGCAASATVDQTTSLLDRLRAAAGKEAKEAHARNGRDENFIDGAFVTQVEQMILRGDAGVQRYLENLAEKSRSEEVRMLAKQLAASVRSDQEQKESAFIDEVEKRVGAAADAILKAKTAKDLDPTLKNLSELRDGRASQFSSAIAQRAASRLNAAVQFTSRWQDYLLNLAMHNQKAARDIMRSLGGDSSAIVPRSEILARAEGLMQTNDPAAGSATTNRVDEIVQKLKTLDDIGPALRELRALRADDASVDGGLISGLTVLQKAYLEFRAGISTSISLPNLESHPALIPLKAQLLLATLPGSLGLTAPAKADETPASYLRRIAAEAKEKKDWPLYVQAIERSRAIAMPTGGGQTYDAFTSFVAALNQEKAGQYADAFESYRQALRTGNTDLPAEFIGQCMTALQRDHKAELDERERITAEKAAAMRRSFSPGGFDPRLRPPESRERRTASPEPQREIMVPAASPSPPRGGE